ncbi:hypothetical protein BOTBODRAFT_171940 [Botryobasidium botryosum FD-172 SS1]|uniref:Aldehyde dehydrogenase domain-containing protein n=1 Tax=Botryobasidium botryosum (strain FD-172 SS1) TaxID=930990 RepID=A0A067MPI1_BOTB1|nr:hypothetical protein BOTBODRAFT_171940 [Botryobasidium botryosum FD-172 SS1]
MPPTFKHNFTAGPFQGTSTFSTGLFINNEFQDGEGQKTIDVFNPSTEKVIAQIAEASAADVDRAVQAAQKAFETSWGLTVPGNERGKLMMKLADLIERDIDEIAAIESLDNGKAFSVSKNFDVTQAAAVIRYYAGWADKVHGNVIEVNEQQLAYTRHEPIGVVGQIIPWNFPLYMFSWKVGPALATGNTIVLKPSEFTSLSALRVCALIVEAGFPPGVVNVVPGYGKIAGKAISTHMGIEKVAFTGSTVVGQEIMRDAASTNLKKVTLELGGKSPSIVFDDADIEQAVRWAAYGVFFNHGQTCCAGSRIFVQESIYDKFLEGFTKRVKSLQVGDPFHPETFQGPQVSQLQYDRVMGYIEHGKKEGATLHLGGERHGTEGYFIQPTIFTDVTADMKICREEIFGPVGVVKTFKDEHGRQIWIVIFAIFFISGADIIHQANDTFYGLAAAIFSSNISRALKTAHELKAGTVWINCVNQLHASVPFGGFKQSGFGRELGEYALDNYTNIKTVNVNLSRDSPI